MFLEMNYKPPSYLAAAASASQISSMDLPGPVEPSRNSKVPYPMFDEKLSTSPKGEFLLPPALGLEREVVLRKDLKCNVGLGLVDVKREAYVEVYIAYIQPYSPADLCGLKIGDQLVAINRGSVVGQRAENISKRFENVITNEVILTVRERPYEMSWILEKDTDGQFNFKLDNGKITLGNSSQESDWAYIMKVNGQSVAEMKDKHVTRIIESSGSFVNVTVVPKKVYKKFILRLRYAFMEGNNQALRKYLDNFL